MSEGELWLWEVDEEERVVIVILEKCGEQSRPMRSHITGLLNMYKTN